jgi:hypothetical protein
MTIEIRITAANASAAQEELARFFGTAQAAPVGDDNEPSLPLDEPTPGPRKRGRKAGSKNTTAAGAAPEGDIPDTAPAGVKKQDAQPEVATNTGTDDGESPLPETSSQDGESTSTAADGESNEAGSSVVSPEVFRAHLQKTATLGAAGYSYVTQALNASGYAKVKDVKPEQYQAIMDKCDELAAAAS